MVICHPDTTPKKILSQLWPPLSKIMPFPEQPTFMVDED